jgi:hypothetical protein
MILLQNFPQERCGIKIFARKWISLFRVGHFGPSAQFVSAARFDRSQASPQQQQQQSIPTFSLGNFQFDKQKEWKKLAQFHYELHC